MSDAQALTLAREHARAIRRLAAAARARAREAWARVDSQAISLTWAAQVPRLQLTLIAAKQAAAAEADPYLMASLSVRGEAPAAAGLVRSYSLASLAADGRSLQGLLALPGITTLQAVKAGSSVDRAMGIGGALAEIASFSEVMDASRTADQVAMVARGQAGYVRMVVGKTCPRCIILAGRWYRWNAGFRRHPACDCVGIPAAEDHAGALSTDPRKTFDAMSSAEQDRVFGKPSADAIRSGADMGQVVNVRRKAAGLAVPGVTAAGRLMPEEIYRQAAGSQERAIALLKSNGYLT